MPLKKHQEARDAVGKKADAEDEDGVQGAACQVQPAQEPAGGKADPEAHGHTYEDLQEQESDGVHHQAPGALRSLGIGDQLDQDDGKHVGHRVVTTRFQLQHLAQVLAQMQLLAPQDGEDGR